jgi:hypothetical protein
MKVIVFWQKIKLVSIDISICLIFSFLLYRSLSSHLFAIAHCFLIFIFTLMNLWTQHQQILSSLYGSENIHKSYHCAVQYSFYLITMYCDLCVNTGNTIAQFVITYECIWLCVIIILIFVLFICLWIIHNVLFIIIINVIVILWNDQLTFIIHLIIIQSFIFNKSHG